MIVNLGEHIVGGWHGRGEEGLGAPRQRKLATNRLVGGEHQEWQPRTQAGHPLGGVAGGGEGHQSLGIEPLGNVTGGIGDHAPLGARNMRQLWDLTVGFGEGHDAGHGAHHVMRVHANGGFPGQHDRIRAVEDGVGHVGSLGPGGTGIFDHGIQHLGGHNHRLGVFPGDLDGAFLHQRHLLQWAFHTQVTAGHHDAVKGKNDGFQGLDSLRLFQLGDHRNPATLLIHDLVHQLHVLRGADEGQGDEVHT